MDPSARDYHHHRCRSALEVVEVESGGRRWLIVAADAGVKCDYRRTW